MQMCQSVTVKSLSRVDIWKVGVRAEPDQAGYDRTSKGPHLNRLIREILKYCLKIAPDSSFISLTCTALG